MAKKRKMDSNKFGSMCDGAEPDAPALEPPTLKTHRLILRQYGPEDAEAIFEACQDPDIQRNNLTQRTPHCVADIEPCFMKFAANGWQGNSRCGFGVFARDDGRLVRA